MDIREIALRMASIIWSDEELSGPENLGVHGKKLERLHSEIDQKRSNPPRRQSHNSTGYNHRKSGAYKKSKDNRGGGKGFTKKK